MIYLIPELHGTVASDVESVLVVLFTDFDKMKMFQLIINL